MFEVGQRISLDIGNYLFQGEISSVTEGEMQVTCPVSLNFGNGNGKLHLPDGQTADLNIEEIPHYSNLVLRIPLNVQKSEAPIVHPTYHTASEARRYARIDCQVSLRIKDLSNTFEMIAKTINLSGGGAQIVSEYPLIVGRDYVLTLDIEGELTTKARVLRKLPNQRYAMKFLADEQAGTMIMRRIFSSLRRQQSASLSQRKSLNFRRG